MKPILQSLLVAALAAVATVIISPKAFICGQQTKSKREAKQVPLERIHFTYHQRGIKLLREGEGDKEYHYVMKRLLEGACRIGASNVFLAQGETVQDAVKATFHVFCVTCGVDTPVSPVQFPKTDQFWLVGYLGTSGSHGEWTITGADIKANTIRLSYERQTGGPQVLDLHPYFAWVPVGRLEPGTYLLELFDEREKDVVLRHTVTITKR